MRMKVQLPNAMEDNLRDQPESIRKLCHDIQTFTVDANTAVLSLYSISQICWSNFGSGEIQRDLAGKLMAVVGALSSLRETINATPKRCLLSPSNVETLTQSIERCELIVHRIEEAVQKLDKHLAAQPEKNRRIRPPGMYNAFNSGEDREPTRILTDCFCAIMHAIVTARAVILSGRDELTSNESTEAFRLKQALPNSDLQAPLKRPISFTCSQSVRQGTNASFQPQSSTLFAQPPAPRQHGQHQPAQPPQAVRNVSDFKPWLKSTESSPDCELFHATPIPSVTTADKMSFFKNNTSGSNSKTTTFGTPQHLEAYILRTAVESAPNSSITWSYNIELLHLNNDAMQMYTMNLGPAYSIINAVNEMSPEQLRLVQERTKARDGHLVSVQFGAAADVMTLMGTLKVKPVVFVVKTAAMPETTDSTAVVNETPIQKPGFPFAGGYVATATAAGSSLFGGTKSASSAFGANTNPPWPFTSKSEVPAGSLFKDAPPVPYEPCYYLEKASAFPTTTNRYMSISSAFGYRHKSFEEIRLDDTKAGLSNKTLELTPGSGVSPFSKSTTQYDWASGQDTEDAL